MALIRIVKTLICCVLLAATAAQAQITTAHVKVLVRGKRCSELKDVYLVVNGNDREDSWVKLEPAGTCRWTADLGDGTISTADARFSIRSDFARSDCQKAVANEEEMSANIEFACCIQGTLRSMSVKIEPPIPFTHNRDVQPYSGSRVPGLKKCVERGTFNEGQGSIGNTQFTGEDVFLHLGPIDRKRQTLGLLLDDIVDDGTTVLTRDGMIYRLIVQRAKGKSRSAPTLSSTAITVDIKKLGALKFERAELEVVK